MKKLLNLAILFLSLAIVSCGDDDPQRFDYTVSIMQPNSEDKHVGDSIHIHVNFDESADQIIHHINVSIKNAVDGSIIYSEPGDAHVHSEGGHYEHHDDFVLDVDPHTDWILEATVWGHEDGLGEVIESIPFHVHP